MKKILAFVTVILITATFLALPVFAATNNINPPSSYSSYESYKDYVQSLLDEGLITQKGADALLEEYSSYNSGTSNGSYFGGCWGWRQSGGGYGGGYGGCHGGWYR